MRRLKVKKFELTRDWRFSSGCRSTRLWTGSGAKSTSSPGRGNWRWCARTACNRRKRSMPRRTDLSDIQLTTTNNRGQRFELWQDKPPPQPHPLLKMNQFFQEEKKVTSRTVTKYLKGASVIAKYRNSEPNWALSN